MTKITQADREAFARLEGNEPGDMGWRMITEPTDGDCYGVWAFARHRMEALEAQAAEIDYWKAEARSVRKELKSEQKSTDNAMDNYDAGVRRIEAQAAEIERLIKASDGDVGLMHWQGEKIETLTAEIDRLRNVIDSLIDRIAGMAALTPPSTIILDPATLTGKAEQ